jgi:hypothetical protein
MHLRIAGKTENTTTPGRRRRARFSDEDRERLGVALRNLRWRFGTWVRLADAIGVTPGVLTRILSGRGGSLAIVVRTARAAGVSVERLLSPTMSSADRCPSCGQPVDKPVST